MDFRDGSSYSISKKLGPVYFNAIGPAPKTAFHFYDKFEEAELVRNGKSILEETKELILRTFRLV